MVEITKCLMNFEMMSDIFIIQSEIYIFIWLGFIDLMDDNTDTDHEEAAETLAVSAVTIQELAISRDRKYTYNKNRMKKMNNNCGLYIQYSYAKLCRCVACKICLNTLCA